MANRSKENFVKPTPFRKMRIPKMTARTPNNKVRLLATSSTDNFLTMTPSFRDQSSLDKYYFIKYNIKSKETVKLTKGASYEIQSI